VVIFAILAGLTGVAIRSTEALHRDELMVPPLKLHGLSLTYYRAPAHAFPPENAFDPYDSFQKDENGDLIIAATHHGFVSQFTQSGYRGFMLKTHTGTPVLVYQETPARRFQYKSNCYGLTFLGGEYWLVGTEVDKILQDGQWTVITEPSARAHDVAVYRDLTGCIVHTAKVVGRDHEGRVLVDSKNGWHQALRSVRAIDVVQMMNN
jgi:hypothetical protein